MPGTTLDPAVAHEDSAMHIVQLGGKCSTLYLFGGNRPAQPERLWRRRKLIPGPLCVVQLGNWRKLCQLRQREARGILGNVDHQPCMRPPRGIPTDLEINDGCNMVQPYD